MSIASKRRCRPPWDPSMSSLLLPSCNTSKEDQKYQSEFLWMVSNEQKFIVKETGCLIPCIYKEYKGGF